METAFKSFPATSMPDRDWWSVLWPDPGAVLRSFGVNSGMVAVDLCCGDGYFTAPLARISGGQVYGVEIDPALLEQTRAEVKRAGVTVLDLILADARELPLLLPGKVNFVLAANIFHGIPDKTGMARAVAAALGPRGVFAVVNWKPLARERTIVLGKPRGPKTGLRMAPETLRVDVESAGFTLSRVIDLPPYHYGAVFRSTR